MNLYISTHTYTPKKNFWRFNIFPHVELFRDENEYDLYLEWLLWGISLEIVWRKE